MADTSTGKLKVFISYSRKDSAAFADELVLGLEDRGFAPFLDRHDIKPGEPWEARLGALIEQSDTVIFVISPESAKSERCVWEIDNALGFSKRILPVIYKPVPDGEIPSKLSNLQFVRFDTAPGMMRPLRELAEALRVDLEWIREHTRLGELAARWQSRNRSESLLLRGDDVVAAKAWAAKRKPDAPEITELQRTFLRASEQADSARAAESKAVKITLPLPLSWIRRPSRTKTAFGLLFVILATMHLFQTERQAVNIARSLDDGVRLVVKGNPNRVDPANEGKLVHVSGELETTARLADPEFAISAEAVLLVRKAEKYQLEKQTGGKLSWSAERKDYNPPFRFSSINVTARDATLGAFRPGEWVLEKLPATIDLPIEAATIEAARARFGGPMQRIDGKLYLGRNPAQPQIGDIRISWRIAKPGPVSLIGRQAGTDLIAFQTSGDPLLLVRPGTLSAEEMIKEQESSAGTWTARLTDDYSAYWFCLLVGWWLALGRLVPALLLSGLIGLAAIAGAWLEYRPLKAAIALTMVGIAATIAVPVFRGWLLRFVNFLTGKIHDLTSAK